MKIQRRGGNYYDDDDCYLSEMVLTLTRVRHDSSKSIMKYHANRVMNGQALESPSRVWYVILSLSDKYLCEVDIDALVYVWQNSYISSIQIADSVFLAHGHVLKEWGG